MTSRRNLLSTGLAAGAATLAAPAVLAQGAPIKWRLQTYAGAALVLNATLLWRALALWRVAGDGELRSKAAMRLFGYSILYLFALYLALLAGAN
mgnify:CR=1 FL=1